MIADNMYRKELKDAWCKFINSGEVDESIVRKEIADSWKRCRASGLDPYRTKIDSTLPLDCHQREALFARKQDLLTVSRRFIKDLHQLIGPLEMVIFLTDEDGFILEAVGEGGIWDFCLLSGAQAGGSLCEKVSGTSALDLVMNTGEPAQVFAQEHFFRLLHGATSTATPILEENGQLYGILEIVVFNKIVLKHPHTLGMAIAAGKAIENHLHLLRESEKVRISNDYLQTVIDQMPKGLILLDQNGKITHVNAPIKKMLNLNKEEILGQPFGDLLPHPSLLRLLESKTESLFKEVIIEKEGKNTRYLSTIKKIINDEGKSVGRYLALEEMKEVKRLVQKITGATAQYSFGDIIGEARVIKEVIGFGFTASQSTATVLIVGESGTGKEMVAQAIHNASLRNEGPFVAINCAALPADLIESELFGYEEGSFTGASKKGRPGKFELSDEGTLFLDEIDKMPLQMQAKLLRVLQDKRILRLGGNQYIPIDTRIIAACNTSLKDLIAKNIFREDLYYRLNVLQILIPPLRYRKEDIPLLVDFFICEKSRNIGKKIKGIQKEALTYLSSLDWPGNVRELENCIERGIHLTKHEMLGVEDVMTVEDQTPLQSGIMPESGSSQKDRSMDGSLTQVEKETILMAIREEQGNLKRAAKRLGIGRSTLYNKIRKYGIHYSVQK
jgi:sigma-54 dependent transcriptional regulator, acetoin dehydrogenase operon transcriptional activator AcoR